MSKFSPYYPFTPCCFYTKISSFIPVLTIAIAGDCFYLLIFYSEKLSLTFAVYGKLGFRLKVMFGTFSIYVIKTSSLVFDKFLDLL